jgi:hypothetical protein
LVRLASNREAARAFRERQKVYIKDLEEKTKGLTAENHVLTIRVQFLETQSKALHEHIASLRSVIGRMLRQATETTEAPVPKFGDVIVKVLFLEASVDLQAKKVDEAMNALVAILPDILNKMDGDEEMSSSAARYRRILCVARNSETNPGERRQRLRDILKEITPTEMRIYLERRLRPSNEPSPSHALVADIDTLLGYFVHKFCGSGSDVASTTRVERLVFESLQPECGPLGVS